MTRSETGYVRWDRAVGALFLLFLAVYSYRPVHPIPWLPGFELPWTWVLAACAAAVAVRHVVYPRPSLAARVFQAARARLLTAGGFVLGIGVVTRVAVVVTGLLAIVLGPPLRPSIPYLTESVFWNLPARWDAWWYLGIASDGYLWDPARTDLHWNVAFFPAYPAVMRVAGNIVTMPAYWLSRPELFGGTAQTRLLFGGWLAAMVAFLCALPLVYELAERDLGAKRARWAVLLLAAFPFAVFYSAPYTESLFLLSVAAAFLGARKGRIGSLFVWGATAGLTRQTGAVVSVPLLMLAYSATRSTKRSSDAAGRRAWLMAAALGPVAGAAAHMVFLWVRFGDPWAWVHAQDIWSHSSSMFAFVTTRLAELRDTGLSGYIQRSPGHALGTLAPILAAVLLWRIWRISRAYAVLVLVTLLPALAIDLPSIGRITAPLFPVFIGLAAVLPNERAAWTTAAIFGALQIWAAVIFFRWGLLY